MVGPLPSSSRCVNGPQAAPSREIWIVKPPTLRSVLFSSRPTGTTGLPSLHPRNVSALCREYASLSRHAALPLCEEQHKLAKFLRAVKSQPGYSATTSHCVYGNDADQVLLALAEISDRNAQWWCSGYARFENLLKIAHQSVLQRW